MPKQKTRDIPSLRNPANFHQWVVVSLETIAMGLQREHPRANAKYYKRLFEISEALRSDIENGVLKGRPE